MPSTWLQGDTKGLCFGQIQVPGLIGRGSVPGRAAGEGHSVGPLPWGDMKVEEREDQGPGFLCFCFFNF